MKLASSFGAVVTEGTPFADLVGEPLHDSRYDWLLVRRSETQFGVRIENFSFGGDDKVCYGPMPAISMACGIFLKIESEFS